MKPIPVLFLAILVVGSAGCQFWDDEAGDPVLQISGTLEIAAENVTIPESAVVMLFWLGDSGTVKFGEGMSSGGEFQLDLDSVPPARALGDGWGYGLFGIYEDGKSIPDDTVTDRTMTTEQALGWAPMHGVIYRSSEAEAVQHDPWANLTTGEFICFGGGDRPVEVECEGVVVIELGDEPEF